MFRRSAIVVQSLLLAVIINCSSGVADECYRSVNKSTDAVAGLTDIQNSKYETGDSWLYFSTSSQISVDPTTQLMGSLFSAESNLNHPQDTDVISNQQARMNSLALNPASQVFVETTNLDSLTTFDQSPNSLLIVNPLQLVASNQVDLGYQNSRWDTSAGSMLNQIAEFEIVQPQPQLFDIASQVPESRQLMFLGAVLAASCLFWRRKSSHRPVQ